MWLKITLLLLVVKAHNFQVPPTPAEGVRKCTFEDTDEKIICFVKLYPGMRLFGFLKGDDVYSAYKGYGYATLEVFWYRAMIDATLMEYTLPDTYDVGCFSFAYHIYYDDRGKFKVYLTGVSNEVLYKPGDLDSGWKTLSVTMKANQTIAMILDTEDYWDGFIGIDEISLKRGAC